MSERISAGVLDEGIAQGGAVLDFVGAGVTVTASANKQTVSIPGGGGSGIGDTMFLSMAFGAI
jgi:hypothetical protein